MVLFDGKAALQTPLGHVYGRRIDVIVVYKVDRLTCALAEFAKLSSWSRHTAFSSFQ
jgi:DNA invertase Pin-like site-specific DNA recombinase